MCEAGAGAGDCVGWWGVISSSVQRFGRVWLGTCKVNGTDCGQDHVLHRRASKDKRGGGIGVMCGENVEFT